MALHINGNEYVTATYVANDLGITRQTLWRWRQQKKIPPGNRTRDRKVLYSLTELAQIRAFANQLEPITGGNTNQQMVFF